MFINKLITFVDLLITFGLLINIWLSRRLGTRWWRQRSRRAQVQMRLTKTPGSENPQGAQHFFISYQAGWTDQTDKRQMGDSMGAT
jgi:hypothetical protein